MQCWCPDIHRPANSARGFAICLALQHFLVIGGLATQSDHRNPLHCRHASCAHTVGINRQSAHRLRFHKCLALVQAKSGHFSSRKFSSWLSPPILYFLPLTNCPDASSRSECVYSHLHPRLRNWL